MASGQGGFQYTDEALATLEKYLSHERLAPYYSLARGDRWIGIQLYERNTECSEALYGVIQGLEVTLRNAIHNVMTKALANPEWYDKIAWESAEMAALQEAKDKVKEKFPLTAGRVIAELTFGFWVRLAAYSYEKSLWFKCLYQIVPKTVRRKTLHGMLIRCKTLRNRIAHHEKIIGRDQDLPTECQQLLDVIGWLNSDVRAWVEHRNCFGERYKKKLKKNRPLSVTSAATEPNPEN